MVRFFCIIHTCLRKYFGRANFEMCATRSGNGSNGQLGHCNFDDSIFKKVKGLDDNIISQVSGGCSHTIVLTSDGSLYTFGSNQDGQTGHDNTSGNQYTAKKVAGCLLDSKKVIFVAAN